MSKYYHLGDQVIDPNTSNVASISHWGSYENAVKSLETLEGCWHCVNCENCKYCHSCSYSTNCEYSFNCRYSKSLVSCIRCAGCSDCQWLTGGLSLRGVHRPPIPIPEIKDIHQKVWAAVKSKPQDLNMQLWHSCNTSHCWAGWIVHIADAYEGEKQTSCPFMATHILAKSNALAEFEFRNFYIDNEAALEKMERLANA